MPQREAAFLHLYENGHLLRKLGLRHVSKAGVPDWQGPEGTVSMRQLTDISQLPQTTKARSTHVWYRMYVTRYTKPGDYRLCANAVTQVHFCATTTTAP